MCRNINLLFNLEPPATDDEIRAAARQYVRKISGFRQPSQVNETAFEAAIDAIAKISSTLLNTLETKAPPKDRAELAEKARQRAARRFAG